MSQTEFYQGMADTLKASALMHSGAAGGSNGSGAEVQRAKVLGELMLNSFEDPYVRKEVQRGLEIALAKEIGTTDIVSLMAASVAPRMLSQRNPETKFLNVCEANPAPKPVINDWQYRIREERIGNQRAPKFHPEGALPPEDQMIRTAKYNQLMFVGGTLTQSIIANEMASTQADVNLMSREIDAELLRIRKAVNYYALSGQLQQSFLPGDSPECRGFLTGSNLNVNDLGGGVDISEADIEAAIDLIAAKFGYDLQLMMLTNGRQIRTIRTLEIDRYSGNDPLSANANLQMLRARFQGFNVPMDKIFEPTIAPPVPILHDLDMPVGTTLLFSVDHPMIAEFHLGGQPGPWTLARMTERMVQMVVAFYGFTVDDPMPEGRAVIKGHN